MPSQEILTVRFKAQGQGELKTAFIALNSATKKLAKTQAHLQKELGKLTGNQAKAKKAVDKYTEAFVKNHRNMGAIQGSLGKFGKTMSGIRSKLLIVAFAAGLAMKAFQALHKALSEFQVAQGKIQAVLLSTSNVSGKTATSLMDMANKMQVSMGISNTAIMEMQARLLTFTSIVGRQFDETIKIAADMSAVLGTDLNQATIQIGKALNDPIKGLGALSRVGVSFTEQQKEQIKTLMESGKIVQAQKVILAELNTEFGAAAEGIRQNSIVTRQAQDASNEWGDALREIATTFELPIAGMWIFIRGVIKTIQQIFQVINAINNWVFTLGGLAGELSHVRAETLAVDQAASAVSNAHAKHMQILTSYNQSIRETAKANKEWTDVKQIQKWSNEINRAVDNDARADLVNKVAEALQNNNFMLKQASDEQDRNKDAVEKSVKSLQFNVDMLGITDEAMRMAMEITKDRKNGIDDLTLAEQDLIVEYIRESNAIEEAKKKVADLKKEQEKLAKSIESTTESLSKRRATMELQETVDANGIISLRKLTEVEKLNLKFQTDEITPAMLEHAQAIDAITLKMKQQTEAIKKQAVLEQATKALTKQTAVLEARIVAEDDLRATLKDLNEVEKLKLQLSEAGIDLTSREAIALIAKAQAIDDVNKKVQNQIDLESMQNEMKEQSIEMLTEFIDHEVAESQRRAEAAIEAIDRVEEHELDNLRASAEYRAASDKEKKKMEEKITKEKDKQRQAERSKVNHDLRKQFYVEQSAKIASIAMNTADAVMKAMGGSPFTAGLPWTALAVAMGAMQTAMVLQQKPPRMQYGGLVGGNRHSAGGTMVEAERGEFVISRPGVEAMGVEALNKINMGMTGSAGSSVTINNPLLGKDTIEDEIVPQIKEALRRGGDIGL